MVMLTLDQIRSFRPCYDPVARGYIPADWAGSVLDALRLDAVPAEDRIWLATRPGLLPDRVLRRFAVGCARRALARDPNPDPRSLAAVDAAETYANLAAPTAEDTAVLRAAQEAAVEAWRKKWNADAAVVAAAAAAAVDAAAADAAVVAAAVDVAVDAAAADAAVVGAAAWREAREQERAEQVRLLCRLLEAQ